MRDNDSSARIDVSVIMTAYNYGHYIAEAIASVQAQTFTRWELIIVDDGSTDNTSQVVAPYLTDKRIVYLHQGNRGQPAAINFGISHARAPWIAFLDADDRWSPEKLQRQSAICSRNPPPDVIYTRGRLMDSSGKEMPTIIGRCVARDVLPLMFQQNFIPFSSAMVRTATLVSVHGFRETYRHANDYDLWLRIAAQGYVFACVDDVLISYRTGHGNLTSRSDVQLKTALEIMDRFVSDYPGRLSRIFARRCYGETYCHLARVYQSQGKHTEALRWAFKGIGAIPGHLHAWKTMLLVSLPVPLVNRYRRRQSGLH
jgi:glycosyltransferase involved in cell wall biosynthesis